MPLGPILGALAGGLASGAAGSLFSGIFGGGANKSIAALGSPSTVGFNAGGLNAGFANGKINLTASPTRQTLVGQIAGTYPQQAAALAKLLGQVTPGSSALRAARLAALQSGRSQTIGDLRDNLARRRVLGSSFAQDALTRAGLDFAQQADQITSDSFMQELNLTHSLIADQYTAARGQSQALLDELNIESTAAQNLANPASAEAGANLRQQASLAAQSLAGLGSFFQPTADAVGGAVGKAVTNYFTPAPAAA